MSLLSLLINLKASLFNKSIPFFKKNKRKKYYPQALEQKCIYKTLEERIININFKNFIEFQ